MGPQTKALRTEADELFYGGAAGGGKTDLIIGLALTDHQRTLVIRNEAAQLTGIRDRIATILGSSDGYNGQERRWSNGDKLIYFGGCKDVGDEARYQGIPHDLKAFDEVTEIRESAYTFIKTWNRGGKRNRVVAAGNPPTTAEGEWVIRRWAPWLDPDYPAERQAMDGELRWFAQIDGQDVEVDGPGIIYRDGEEIQPKSRTFIKSKVEDNIYLLEAGYKATLQDLPEPLRSKLLRGDFTAGADDDPWQVIPTAWVTEAMDRWKPDGHKAPMTGIGADIARGGKDRTVLAVRHGWWFDELDAYPGTATPDGSTAAGLILTRRRNACGIAVDVVGVGSSAYDHLKGNDIPVIAVSGAESASSGGVPKVDETGQMGFANERTRLWWRFRELLNPERRMDIALPPDNELKRELCAPRWRAKTASASHPARVIVEVESKYGAEGWNIVKRIGKSPDKADAVVMCAHEELQSGSKKWAPLEYPEQSYV